VLGKTTCRAGEGEGVYENERSHREYVRKLEESIILDIRKLK
jgi:hypothetical protein